jgi:hypothetical protein
VKEEESSHAAIHSGRRDFLPQHLAKDRDGLDFAFRGDWRLAYAVHAITPSATSAH